ncbi:hypothetical protein [Vreelandella alkaliphila]|uniref:Uncharacterized protein n=1 Tax=Vreelandella alkaliphila TaxID=272774 RepID=A0A7C9P0Y8_9GAMM|nr:hypothetical protein [Halomonas alkaliphila]NDL70373.1 hypothetical protein [Halomonas alkaliphila]
MNNISDQDFSNPPDAVFICNSPLHVYNALQAAHHWGLDTANCVLVFKIITDKIQLDATLETLVKWKEVVRIDPFPVPPRLKAKGNKKRYLQYKFFREWQRKLDFAKGVQFVFLCHNRQVDNRVIASYLNARELIWLEDGTLSYFLWQEERVFTPEVRARRSKSAATKNAAAAKKMTAAKAAKKSVTSTPVTAEKPTSKTSASKSSSAKKGINKNSSSKAMSRKSPNAKKVGVRKGAGVRSISEKPNNVTASSRSSKKPLNKNVNKK